MVALRDPRGSERVGIVDREQQDGQAGHGRRQQAPVQESRRQDAGEQPRQTMDVHDARRIRPEPVVGEVGRGRQRPAERDLQVQIRPPGNHARASEALVVGPVAAEEHEQAREPGIQLVAANADGARRQRHAVVQVVEPPARADRGPAEDHGQRGGDERDRGMGERACQPGVHAE